MQSMVNARLRESRLSWFSLAAGTSSPVHATSLESLEFNYKSNLTWSKTEEEANEVGLPFLSRPLPSFLLRSSALCGFGGAQKRSDSQEN